MKITVTAETPQDDVLTAQVTVASADVDAAIAKTYKDIAYKYNFQGFRRGRAPRPVIDSIMGKEAVLAQTTNDLLNQIEPMILEELDATIIGEMSYGDDPGLVAQGSDYVVTATMTVPPICELTSYEAPVINMPPEEATEAEIDLQIEQLLNYQASYEDISDDRACVEGDIVSVNIENVEGGSSYAGENRLLQLNGQQVPEDLQAGIVGMTPGETKEVSWSHSHEHEGEVHEHKFVVNVTLNSIKEVVVPELTEELCKKSFGFDSVEDFRDAVKEEIEGDKKSSLPNLKEDRVVEAVGKLVDLEEIPEAYGNEVFNELASEFLNQLQSQNLSLDYYLQARGIKTDDFIADLHAQADDRARQSLALDAVARKMGFDASDEDVRAEFEKAGMPDAYDEWRDQGRLPAIRESVRRTKALDWLVENAQVTIVDEVAERAAADEAEAEPEDEAAETVDAEPEAVETVDAEPEAVEAATDEQ